MNKLLIVFLLGISSFSFAYAAPQPIKNAGFVPANIWYSKDPFFAGEKIRIYTILFNGSAYDLDGTVEFLDNGVLINKASFSLASGGRVRDVWVDWQAREGKHSVTARIVDASASLTSGTKSTIALDNAETGKSERTVDLDTDGDDTGNADDIDDDGDGVLDVDELRNGTDPLKADTNGDGISDSKELELLAVKKVEEGKLLNSATSSSGTIMGIVKKVEDVIPDSIKTGAITGVNTLENFRISNGYKISLAKDEKAHEIEDIKKRVTPTEKDVGVIGAFSNATEKPFAYVMLASLTLLKFVLETKIVFYAVLVYLIYRIIRWIDTRIRNR